MTRNYEKFLRPLCVRLGSWCVCVCLNTLTIDLVVSGSHYETPMVSNGQQWAEPANRQRHNECELISVALTELIVMAH